MVLDKPLIMYGGVATLILMVATACIPFFNARGVTRIPLVWHKRLAAVSLLAALMHGLLGLSIYFGF